MRANSRVKFVLSGRKQPQLDRSWKNSVELRLLQPLTETHVAEYLLKRGIQQARDEIAKILLIATRGNMFDLATAVDAYLERA
jgi:hypothetical protein